MAGDRQIEMRLSRLENDRDSLYDLVVGIGATQQEHSRRFDAVDQRLDAVDQRLDSVDQRLGSVLTTLDEVVRRLPEPT